MPNYKTTTFKFFTLLSVILLGVGGWYLWYPDQKPRTEPPPPAAASTVEYKQYSKSGQLSAIIQAKRITQLSGDQFQLSNPQLVTQNPSWKITAKLGRITLNRQVDLNQHVVIRELNGGDPMQLTTESISYFPQQKIVLSKQPVQLTRGTLQIHAKQMQAHLNQKLIKLDRIVLTDTDLHITAKQATCYINQQQLTRLEFHGDVTIQSRQHQMTADNIDYDVLKKRLVTGKNSHTKLLLNRELINFRDNNEYIAN